MAKALSMPEFLAILLVLGMGWLVIMRFLWPRLLAATVLIYSAGAFMIFVGIVLYAIFKKR